MTVHLVQLAWVWILMLIQGEGTVPAISNSGSLRPTANARDNKYFSLLRQNSAGSSNRHLIEE